MFHIWFTDIFYIIVDFAAALGEAAMVVLVYMPNDENVNGPLWNADNFYSINTLPDV